MTVSTSTNKAGPYAGAGIAGPFTVGFRFLSASHLKVIKTSTTGADTTLTLTTDYTVSGAGAASGSVTLTSPLLAGERLTIVRDVPFTQEADYVANDAFPAESHEAALDLLTMQTQQLKERTDAALTLPERVTGVSTELPAPVGGNVIGWDEAGTALRNIDPATLASIIAYSNRRVLVANGGAASYTLDTDPGVIANTTVFVSGVAQTPGVDYILSGTTLTPTPAFPSGTGNVVIVYGQALPVGTITADLLPYDATANYPIGTIGARLKASPSVQDAPWSASGGGVVSATAAFRAALLVAAGGVLKFPKGQYRMPFSEVNGFSIPAGTTIEGEGKAVTEIVLVPDSTSYRNLFVLAANVTFRNIKITLQCPAGGSAAFFSGTQTGLTLDDCYLDGGTTNAGAVVSHQSYGINFGNTGTVEDITIRGCDITRFRFFFLKTNTATSIQRRISVEHCDFFANVGEDCSFNSPAVGAVMDDIQVYACHFRDSRAKSASLTGIYVGFASCSNYRVGLCDFQGPITDCIHIEENSTRGTVTGNTLLVDGNGIVVQDNNVGGTSLMPSDLTITANSVSKAGTLKAASTYGIWLVNDATPETPARRVIIADNTCNGFFAGIQTGASGDDACVIADNTAHGCTRGFGLMAYVSAVHDNTSSACDIGVVCDSSTMAVRHRFIECATTVDAINRPAHLVDPMFLWNEFSVGAGATVNKATFALGTGDRVYGEWAVSAFCDTPADNANRRNRATWDGTTWASTSLMFIEPGAIALTVNNTGSVMNIGTFAASAKTGVRLAASLSGSVVVAV